MVRAENSSKRTQSFKKSGGRFKKSFINKFKIRNKKLRYLYKTNELLGFQLLTLHNVHFMNSLMLYIQDAINNDMLEEAERKWYLT